MLILERYLGSDLPQGEAARIAAAKVALGNCLYELGYVERALAVHTESLGIAKGLVDARGVMPEHRWRLSRDLLAVGRVDAAAAEAEQARTEPLPDDPFSQASTRAALAEARAAQGWSAEGEALFRTAISILEPLGYGIFTADVRVRFAVFLISQDRRDKARLHLEAARDFYSDPLAIHKREAIEALLRQCDDVAAPEEAKARREHVSAVNDEKGGREV